MATESIDYTVPDDFDFSPSEVVFSASGAVLAFAPAPATFIQFYNNDSGFTYDNTKLEFSAGTVHQLSQVPVQSSFGATYDSTINGSWSTDGLSLPPNSTTGTPTATGKLDLIGNSVTYDFTDGLSPLSGAIKYKITPNYSGSPAANQTLIFYQDTTTANHDRLQLIHQSNGNISMSAYDTDGIIFAINTPFGVWAPTAGVEYEMELDWNFNGNQHLFIDGAEVGPGLSFVASRGNNGTTIGCQFGDTTGVSDFEINDLLVFKSLQNNSSYTPGYTVIENIYTEAAAVLPDFVYTSVDDLTSYTSIVSENAVNQRYTVNGLYWNGSDWFVSDGSYAESSTDSDLSSNFATFPAVSDTVSLVVIFPTSDTQGTISKTDFNYVGVAYRPSGRITQKTDVPLSVITTFSEVLSNKPAGTSITFILEIQSIDTWFDGAAWVLSDGSLAQSNTASDIQNNLGSLVLNPQGNRITVVCWISTTDDQVTPEITTVDYQFLFNLPIIPKPSITTVYGIPTNISGVPYEKAFLIAEYQGPPIPFVTGEQVALVGTVRGGVITDDGGIILELVSSQLYGGKYLFKMESYPNGSNTNCPTIETWGYAEIPPQAAINWTELTFTEEP